jgi:hypothetical protein
MYINIIIAAGPQDADDPICGVTIHVPPDGKLRPAVTAMNRPVKIRSVSQKLRTLAILIGIKALGLLYHLAVNRVR